jgi:2-methylcitrate dehydratase PrpD
MLTTDVQTTNPRINKNHLLAPVVSRVKYFFVDYLGIALRASSLDSSKPARALMIPGQATLLGLGTTSADWAALAIGMAAHSMELDDTFLEGSIHNESFLYSATMELAEE